MDRISSGVPRGIGARAPSDKKLISEKRLDLH